MTVEARNANTCLDCNTSWKAADLYKSIQIIKNITVETLNLVREDRDYMNRFMSEVGSFLGAISEVEKKYAKLVGDREETLNQEATKRCIYVCIAWLVYLFSAASLFRGGGLFLTLILFPLIGLIIGAGLDKANKKHNEQ